MTVLACGACSDGLIGSVLPFVLYWTVLFWAWCIVWGFPALLTAQDCGEQLAVSPLLYFLVAIAAFFLTAPVSMGSFLFPMLFIAPIWLVSVYRRRPIAPQRTTEAPATSSLARTEASVRRIVLCTSTLAVPLAYLRLYAQVHGWL